MKQRLSITNKDNRPAVTLYGEIGTKPKNFTAADVANFRRTIDAYNETGTMRLYGPIDPLFGIDPEQFARDIDAMGNVPTIDVYINSPGGCVFDGFAIYSILNRHPATKAVHVDGLAASAAAFIAMVGNTISMSEQARFMIHNANAIMGGSAEDLRDTADLLDSLSETIAGIYSARTGQALSVVQRWMDNETWFDSAEALDAGLCDSVVPLVGAQNSVATRLRQIALDGAEIERAMVANTLRKLDAHSKEFAPPKPVSVADRLQQIAEDGAMVERWNAGRDAAERDQLRNRLRLAGHLGR